MRAWPLPVAAFLAAAALGAAREGRARAVTVVGGAAGPRVRSVSAAGRVLALSRRRAFLHVVRGVREPRDVPVEVSDTDGSRRRFGA